MTYFYEGRMDDEEYYYRASIVERILMLLVKGVTWLLKMACRVVKKISSILSGNRYSV